MKLNIRRTLKSLACVAAIGMTLLTAGCEESKQRSAPENVRQYLIDRLWFDTIPECFKIRTHLDSIRIHTPEDAVEVYKTVDEYTAYLYRNSQNAEAAAVMGDVANIIRTDPSPTVNDIKELLDLYVRLGATFSELGMPGVALDYYRTGLELAGDTVYDGFRAMLYNNLGILYAESEYNSNAESSFRAALEINTRREKTKEIVLNYTNLAQLAYMKDSLAEALRLSEEALSYIDPENYGRRWANLRLQQGVILTKMGEYDMALGRFKEAQKLLGATDSHGQLADLYVDMTHYFVETNEPDSALVYGRKALDMAKKTHRSDAAMEAFKYYANAYAAKGAKADEARVLRRKLAMKDSLIKAERRLRIDTHKAQGKPLNLDPPQDRTLEWILGVSCFILLVLLGWSLVIIRKLRK